MSSKKIKDKKNETFILLMPAFNEEKKIEKTVISWVNIIQKFPGSEILIIDGDSNDNTRVKVKKLRKKYKFIKLIHKKREGYGKDLIFGYKKSISTIHNWIFQTDSDGHFEAKDFYKLWSQRNRTPFILGYRYNRSDETIRLIIAAMVRHSIRILFNQNIKDSNIPFRLIKRSYLKEIINKIPQETIAPNIFLSILASKGGYELQNIPVKHRYVKNGHNRKRILKGALKGALELIIFAYRSF